MQKKTAFKIGMFTLLIVLGISASAMYALAYSEKRQVIYSNTITVEAREVKYEAFYLPEPAGVFEVKLTVSKGTIKWTPHSAVMFEDTLGWFPCKVGDKRLDGT
jgi:Rieske Fe-S protein